MSLTSSESKFQHQTRIAYYLERFLFLVIVILSLILLQVFFLSINKKRSEHESIQIRENSTNQLRDYRAEGRVRKNGGELGDLKHVYMEPIENEIDSINDSTIGELFDLEQGDQHSNKSMLRIKRNLQHTPSRLSKTNYASHMLNKHGATNQIDEMKDNVEEDLNFDLKNSHQNDILKATKENAKDNWMLATIRQMNKFNKLLSPDDSIVSPATESRVKISINGNNPGLYSADSKVSIIADKLEGEPNVAELADAETAADILLGDLAFQEDSNEANNPNDDEDIVGDSKNALVKDQSTLQSPDHDNLYLIDTRKQQEAQSRATESQGIPEQVPESLDSLVRSEQEEMGEYKDDNNRTDLNQEDNDSISPPNAADENVDEDQMNYESQRHRKQPSLLAISLPPSNLDLAQPANTERDVMADEHQLVAAERDSPIDLNTAAGHYYDKKKKKKVKKVIKKKYKKKKLNKIKIVKYKKKKVMKKPKKKAMKVHHDHGKYYMYAKVPKKRTWEFGFKKGNKKHWIERHEKGHKSKFKTKVKWYDKKSKGKGVHIWDYNHHDKKKHE